MQAYYSYNELQISFSLQSQLVALKKCAFPVCDVTFSLPCKTRSCAKIVMCVWLAIILEICYTYLWTLCVAGYVENAIVGAFYHTGDRQANRLIQLAGPERETILHLCVTACRRRGTYCHAQRAISLGSSTGAGDFVLQLIHLESLWNKLQEC